MAKHPWHERWRKARISAGYSSAEKLAAAVRERGFRLHRLTATSWDTGRAKPGQEYRAVLAEISPLFAKLLAELPNGRESRADLQARVDRLERHLAKVETAAADAAERLEARIAELAAQLPGEADQGQ